MASAIFAGAAGSEDASDHGGVGIVGRAIAITDQWVIGVGSRGAIGCSFIASGVESVDQSAGAWDVDEFAFLGVVGFIGVSCATDIVFDAWSDGPEGSVATGDHWIWDECLGEFAVDSRDQQIGSFGSDGR